MSTSSSSTPSPQPRQCALCGIPLDHVQEYCGSCGSPTGVLSKHDGAIVHDAPTYPALHKISGQRRARDGQPLDDYATLPIEEEEEGEERKRASLYVRQQTRRFGMHADATVVRRQTRPTSRARVVSGDGREGREEKVPSSLSFALSLLRKERKYRWLLALLVVLLVAEAALFPTLKNPFVTRAGQDRGQRAAGVSSSTPHLVGRSASPTRHPRGDDAHQLNLPPSPTPPLPHKVLPTTPTPVPPTPTALPSPSPTPVPPTPTLVKSPVPGTVLWRANLTSTGNPDGWVLSGGWHSGYGLLSCASGCDGDLTVPYVPTTTDYALVIKVSSFTGGGCLMCDPALIHLCIHVTDTGQQGYCATLEPDGHLSLTTGTETSSKLVAGIGDTTTWRVAFHQGKVSLSRNGGTVFPLGQMANTCPDAGYASLSFRWIAPVTIQDVEIVAA